MLVLSPDIVRELATLVEKPDVVKLLERRQVTTQDFINGLAVLIGVAEEITPTGEAPPCRDEKDRMYLHCAVAGEAEYLISRDQDLLSIETIGACRIVSPEAFLQAMQDKGEDADGVT